MRTAQPPSCPSASTRSGPRQRPRHSRRPSGENDVADAFLHAVVERYGVVLLRYVGRLTSGDRHRAEDIVQETFLRAWQSAGALYQGSDDAGLAPWLFKVARNLAIDAHRKDRAIPVGTMPAEVLGDLAVEDPADAVVDRCVVIQVLARLSPEHRDVLVLLHLLGRSGAEAARTMGVPRGTVKSRAHYAVLAARRELAARGEVAPASRKPSPRPAPESSAA